jgi:hypothetical protein
MLHRGNAESLRGGEAAPTPESRSDDLNLDGNDRATDLS